MFKRARLLTHLTPAATSPTRHESAKTALADCFSILLEGCKELKPRTRATINDHSLQEHHRWSDPQPAVAIARAVDHISQLAQVYAGQGKYKYVEAEPVYLQG